MFFFILNCQTIWKTLMPSIQLMLCACVWHFPYVLCLFHGNQLRKYCGLLLAPAFSWEHYLWVDMETPVGVRKTFSYFERCSVNNMALDQFLIGIGLKFWVKELEMERYKLFPFIFFLEELSLFNRYFFWTQFYSVKQFCFVVCVCCF